MIHRRDAEIARPRREKLKIHTPLRDDVKLRQQFPQDHLKLFGHDCASYCRRTPPRPDSGCSFAEVNNKLCHCLFHRIIIAGSAAQPPILDQLAAAPGGVSPKSAGGSDIFNSLEEEKHSGAPERQSSAVRLRG